MNVMLRRVNGTKDNIIVYLILIVVCFAFGFIYTGLSNWLNVLGWIFVILTAGLFFFSGKNFVEQGAFNSITWKMYLDGSSDTLTFQDVTNNTYPFRIEANTPTNTLYLDSSGNVGIGTTSPRAKIDAATGVGLALVLGADVNAVTRTDSTRKFARFGMVHYDLDEQLDAIKQLGESRSVKALEYLRRLNESEFKPCNPADRMDGAGKGWHPNAKGQLHKALDGFFEGYGHSAGIPAHQKPDEKAEKIVCGALSQLEKDIG